MCKLLCDSASGASAVTETLAPCSPPLPQWHTLPPPSPPPPPPANTWSTVLSLEDQQRRSLVRIWESGVAWKRPPTSPEGSLETVVFRLDHGGDVEADGNCLFTAASRAMTESAAGVLTLSAVELRKRTVGRFREEYGGGDVAGRERVDDVIRHMYCPDLRAGWGVHVVQEVKMIAKKEERSNLDAAIQELVNHGLQREMAAETIYKERCIAVNDGDSWAKYMSISGSMEDEYGIITLQYTEEGLLSVDENRAGYAAAFGDDIAIECLATEFRREVYVVQAHGTDAMVDEDNCVFFLPHRPRGKICDTPIFLFMKGTGWCGAGADHYEPIIATPLLHVSPEKAAVKLWE